jgi:ATP-binding cassette subfamily B protein
MGKESSGSMMSSSTKLLTLIKLDKKDISTIYVFAILGGLISLSLPLGIQTIISFVQTNQISASVVVLITIVVLGVFLNGLVQVRQMQVIEKVEQKIFTRYSLAFADKLPKLNIEKLDNYYLPELVNRYFDTISLTKGIEKLLLDIPAAIIQIFFGLILLSFYHPVFIAFGALLIFIVIIIIRFSSPQGLATSLKASDYKYGMAAWLEEMARVIKSFKFSKGTSLHMKKSDTLISNYLEARTAHFRVLLTQYWSFILFKIIITAAMLMMGTVLLIDNKISVGQFIAADIVIITIIGSVEKLIGSLDKVYDTLTSIQKLSKILDSEIETSGGIPIADNNKGMTVEFDKVSFSYNDEEKVLDEISFRISPGQMVCLKGASGSGRTTILRLLSGAYNNFDGSVLIDSIPIGNYNLQSLRSNTGILLNQQDIFQGTLLENITLGNETITIKNITELAEKVGLSDFIKNNKEGFDTILDPLGKRLSKNERQNILLLRALVGNARLLLLEEPFDHLDEQQKANIIELLKANKKYTIIITSQKEDTASFCDVVFTLNEGKIV